LLFYFIKITKPPGLPDSNFLSAMHGFRDNVLSLSAGYDVIMISPPGGASGDFMMDSE